MRICLINPVSSPVMILMMVGVIQMKYDPFINNCFLYEIVRDEACLCEHAQDVFVSTSSPLVFRIRCICNPHSIDVTSSSHIPPVFSFSPFLPQIPQKNNHGGQNH